MRVTVIYGPTASGKSSLALSLADQHDGIIINADSMQVYDALHVLTAHPSQDEQEKAPHRLYGTLTASETCSAASWRDMAVKEIEQAFEAGKRPIIVGGTGFYIKSLMEGLSPIPDVAPEVRTRAMEKQEELGNPAFHAALSEKDPEMAARLNPNDTQRLIRAWEVLEGTGKSLLYWQSLPNEGPPEHWEFETHFVNPERDVLYERCNSRFDLMLEQGILDEVDSLQEQIEKGIVAENAAITNALGFKPLRDYRKGLMSLADAIEQSKTDTRHYAKRQVTWFRHQI